MTFPEDDLMPTILSSNISYSVSFGNVALAMRALIGRGAFKKGVSGSCITTVKKTAS